MRTHEGPEPYAYIRAAPGKEKEVMYPNWKAKLAVHRYYSIFNDLRLHGASQMDADNAARWARDEAEIGESKIIDPGIEISIELPKGEQENEG